jgi:hypothetical protein
MPDTEPRRWRVRCPSPISGRTVITDVRIDGPNYTFTCPCHGVTAHGLVVDVPETDKHPGSWRGHSQGGRVGA